MVAPGHHTWTEIQSQPETWRATLAGIRARAGDLRAIYGAAPPELVAYTGCGSPYYLALAAAALYQELSAAPARALPASEIWLNGRAALPALRRALLVAVSRSGQTTELLRAVEAFRSGGRGRVLTLASEPGRPLGELGDLNLSFPAGREESFAQTRAFTTLYLAAAGAAMLWAGRDDLLASLEGLPDACARALADSHQTVRALARDRSIDRFYFLGSGPRYGLACELSLKMKEMSLSHSEPFHFLEFRHGPQSMATGGALVVGLLSETSRAHELAVLEDMRRQGARTLAVGESGADVSFGSGLSEAAYAALYLPVGQLLGYERALANGQNPDRPANLSPVVTLGS